MALQRTLILFISVFSTVRSNWFTNTYKCSEPHCAVICDKSHSCVGKTIDASKSTSLNIECSYTKTCSKLHLSHGPTDSVTIKCTSPNACSNAKFEFDNTKNAFIQCQYNFTDDTTTGACLNAQFHGQYCTNISVDCNGLDCYQSIFHINNSETAEFRMDKPSTHSYTEISIFGSDITNSLIVRCLHSNSCRENTIYCPDKGNCTLYCNGTFACAQHIYLKNRDQYFYFDGSAYDTDFHCMDTGATTRMEYQSDRHEWGCDSYSRSCCPYISKPDLSIQNCAQNECEIMCTADNACLDIINATNAVSLSVECIGDDSCIGKEIECPHDTSASCNVLCDGVNACKDSKIQISSMTLLNVSCVDELSCHGLRIWPMQYDLLLNIDSVSLLCQNSRSCQNLTFGYGVTVEDMNVQCIGDGSCLSVTFADASPIYDSGYTYTATVINNSFKLNCSASMACTQMTLNMVSSANADNKIICDNAMGSESNNGACYRSFFSMYGISDNVGDWNVECNAFDCEKAYFEWSGSLPRHPSNTLYANCYGSDSCSEARFDGESASHLDLQCRSDRSCHNVVMRGAKSAASATNIVCHPADNVCSGMKISSRWKHNEDYLLLKCPSPKAAQTPCDPIIMECDMNYVPYIENPSYLHYNTDTQTYDGCVDSVNSSTLVSDDGMYCCPFQMEYTLDRETTQSTFDRETTQSTFDRETTQYTFDRETTQYIVISEERSDVSENDKSHKIWDTVAVICGSILCIVLIGAIVRHFCVSAQKKRRNKASALLSVHIGDCSYDEKDGVGDDDVEAQPYVPPTDTEMTAQ